MSRMKNSTRNRSSVLTNHYFDTHHGYGLNYIKFQNLYQGRWGKKKGVAHKMKTQGLTTLKP